MSTFMPRPRIGADDLVGALRARDRRARVRRDVTEAGVEVVGVQVEQVRVRAVWEEWRRKHPETGWWPYVTPRSPNDVVRNGVHDAFDSAALEDLLAEVAGQDHDARAASVVVSNFRRSVDCTGDQEEWRDDYDADRLALRLGPELAEPLPGVPRWGSGDGPFGGGRWVNFVAARGGHEVPVVLPYLYGTANWWGYGDRILTPADDAALLRRWHERWGAELFFAEGACLELVVDRPPLGPRDAAEATCELLGYCDDTVQVPERDGDGMVRSTMWSLWWD
ncbi:DUF4253 domain-containing protein [Streptomyces sp. CO7]